MTSILLSIARALPAAVAGLVALLLVATLASATPTEPPPEPTAAVEPESPVTVGEQRQVRKDDAPVPAARRERPVFVCDDAGTPVFADRPCGPALVPSGISFAAPPAGAAVSTLPPLPRASTRPRPQPEAESRPGKAASERCASLRRQLEELDDRMRTGYSSREAARLWNRWRELKARLRSEKC